LPVDNDEVLLPHFNPEVKEFGLFRVNYFTIPGYVLAEYLSVSYFDNSTCHAFFLLSRARSPIASPEKEEANGAGISNN